MNDLEEKGGNHGHRTEHGEKNEKKMTRAWEASETATNTPACAPWGPRRRKRS